MLCLKLKHVTYINLEYFTPPQQNTMDIGYLNYYECPSSIIKSKCRKTIEIDYIKIEQSEL